MRAVTAREWVFKPEEIDPPRTWRRRRGISSLCELRSLERISLRCVALFARRASKGRTA